MKLFFASLLLAAGILLPATASAQSTTFTYQGRLDAAGQPAQGRYDLTFSLWDAASGPAQVGDTLTNPATPVSNGLFVVTLDFGSKVLFAGNSWLEISVRTNGGGAFTTVSPRQQLTAAPYAITAGRVIAGGLAAGTYASAVNFNHPGNQFRGSFAGDGAGTTNLQAGALTTGTVPDARLSSNVALRNAANTFAGDQIIQGSVGIRAAPLADLHVRGSGTNGMVLITPNTSNSRSQLMLSENTGGTLGMILRYDGDVSSNPLHLVGRSSGGIESELVTVERNGGNVGIGTNDPAFKLHVAGSLQVLAGGTALTINPDGSIIVQSAKTVSIAAAGNMDLTTAQNLSLASSNLMITVQKDLAVNVGRRVTITNNSAVFWKIFDEITVEADGYKLTTKNDAEMNARNINLNATSNVNVKASGDVLIKGSKIGQN